MNKLSYDCKIKITDQSEIFKLKEFIELCEYKISPGVEEFFHHKLLSLLTLNGLFRVQAGKIAEIMINPYQHGYKDEDVVEYSISEFIEAHLKEYFNEKD